MSRFIQSNLFAALNFSQYFEAYQFGPMGFEVWDKADLMEWPRSRFFGDFDAGNYIFTLPSWGDFPQINTGSRAYPYRIWGYVKDEVGDPATGVTVELYRTSDNQFLTEALSGPGGQYDLGCLDNTIPCYIVAYVGPPAKTGATVRTLVGT